MKKFGSFVGLVLVVMFLFVISSAKVTAQSEVQVDSSAEVDLGGNSVSGESEVEVSVESQNIRNWDSDEKSGFIQSVKTHTQLRSEQDLNDFATGILLRDENVAKVEVNGDENVKVGYRMPARFLGLFNTSLRMNAEVSSEGNAQVRYPWHGFLYSKIVSTVEVKTALEAELRNQLGSNINGWISISQEGTARTGLGLQIITNILKASYDAAVSGTLEGSVN